MNTEERKRHWENIFRTKDTSQVSWYQPKPEISLEIIDKLKLAKTAKIIDAGCGDSYLPDYLLEKGFNQITLVDISEKALETVRKRLGENAKSLCFEVADITTFSTDTEFDLWHDRAVFHFLTDENDIQNYLETLYKNIKPGGYLVIGTFSVKGPNLCSGLQVRQYSREELTKTFAPYFQLIDSFTSNHFTPSGGVQNFQFGIFKRKEDGK